MDVIYRPKARAMMYSDVARDIEPFLREWQAENAGIERPMKPQKEG